MTKDEIQQIVNSMEWISLGAGGYNKVFVSTTSFAIGGFDGLWILKKPKWDEDPLCNNVNDPKRAIRKWSILNPNYPAYEIDTETEGESETESPTRQRGQVF